MMADLLKKDDPDALFLLGNEYHDGTSVHPKDKDKALQLWEAAAKEGHVQAAFQAASYYLDGKKEPSKGFEYMLQVAEAGDAQLIVSRLYAFGHGCTRDEGAARRFNQRASLQGASWGTEDKVEEGSIEELLKGGGGGCEVWAGSL